MAYQCFNFLNKNGEVDPSLNQLIPSSDEEEEKKRSRSRSRHSSKHHHSHSQ